MLITWQKGKDSDVVDAHIYVIKAASPRWRKGSSLLEKTRARPQVGAEGSEDVSAEQCKVISESVNQMQPNWYRNGPR